MTPEEMAVKITEVDQRSKSNTHQIMELKESTKVLTSLTVSVEKIATRLDGISASFTEMKDDLSELKDKPSHWWEALIKALIAALVGAVIGYFVKG